MPTELRSQGGIYRKATAAVRGHCRPQRGGENYVCARAAARLVLGELDRLTEAAEDFAFESRLSGKSYLARFHRWKEQGYSIEIVYLRLSSARLALKRIAIRVRQGGHDVPPADVIRRFRRGLNNFENLYRPLADHWALYDNSGANPVLIEKSK